MGDPADAKPNKPKAKVKKEEETPVGAEKAKVTEAGKTGEVNADGTTKKNDGKNEKKKGKDGDNKAANKNEDEGAKGKAKDPAAAITKAAGKAKAEVAKKAVEAEKAK